MKKPINYYNYGLFLGDVHVRSPGQLFFDDNVPDEEGLDEDITDEVIINNLSCAICSKPPQLSPHYYHYA